MAEHPTRGEMDELERRVGIFDANTLLIEAVVEVTVDRQRRLADLRAVLMRYVALDDDDLHLAVEEARMAQIERGER